MSTSENRSLVLAPAVASMTFSNNPLVGPPAPVEVRPFTPVGSLAPKTISGVLMLRFNGEWLLRKDWDRIVVPGDIIEWHEIPQGGNTSRTVLQAVQAIVSLYIAVNYGAGWALLFNVAASAVINALVPLQTPDLGNGGALATPGSVYNGGTAANQARLGQPIPVIYGRHKVFPDYASQPYIEYVDNQQIFHCAYSPGLNPSCPAWFIDCDEASS